MDQVVRRRPPFAKYQHEETMGEFCDSGGIKRFNNSSKKSRLMSNSSKYRPQSRSLEYGSSTAEVIPDFSSFEQDDGADVEDDARRYRTYNIANNMSNIISPQSQVVIPWTLKLSRAITIFSLLGMIFMMLLAMLIDAQPFYITGIASREKHHRVSSNAIKCSIAYGITALCSFYISIYHNRIAYILRQQARQFTQFQTIISHQPYSTYFYKRRTRRSYSTLSSTAPTVSATAASSSNASWFRSWWRPKPQQLFHHELPLYHNHTPSAAPSITKTSSLMSNNASNVAPPVIAAATANHANNNNNRYYQYSSALDVFWKPTPDGNAKKSKKKK